MTTRSNSYIPLFECVRILNALNKARLIATCRCDKKLLHSKRGMYVCRNVVKPKRESDSGCIKGGGGKSEQRRFTTTYTARKTNKPAFTRRNIREPTRKQREQTKRSKQAEKEENAPSTSTWNSNCCAPSYSSQR